jgi:hypothetical protein
MDDGPKMSEAEVEAILQAINSAPASSHGSGSSTMPPYPGDAYEDAEELQMSNSKRPSDSTIGGDSKKGKRAASKSNSNKSTSTDVRSLMEYLMGLVSRGSKTMAESLTETEVRMFRDAQNGKAQKGTNTKWTVPSKNGEAPKQFTGVKNNGMPFYNMNLKSFTMSGAKNGQMCFNLLFLARHASKLTDAELLADQKVVDATQIKRVIRAAQDQMRIIGILAWTAITELCCALLAYYPIVLFGYIDPFERAIDGTSELKAENARLKAEVHKLESESLGPLFSDWLDPNPTTGSDTSGPPGPGSASTAAKLVYV